ncbi:MAG: hypothetical protein ACE5DX_05860, partial [Candidatus Dojkabacteria bacterium]
MKSKDNLEKFLTEHLNKPETRLSYKGFEIFVSDGGPHYDQKAEFPLGYYETTYAVGAGEKILWLRPILFDSLHNIKELTENGRKEGRINATIQIAKEDLDAYAKKNQ